MKKQVGNSQLNIRIDLKLKEAFIEAANENGTNATELLIAWIEEYLGAKSSFFERLEERTKKIVKDIIDDRLSAIESKLSDVSVTQRERHESISDRIAALENRLKELRLLDNPNPTE